MKQIKKTMFSVAVISAVSTAGYGSADVSLPPGPGNTPEVRPGNNPQVPFERRLKDRIDAGFHGGVVTHVNADGSFTVGNKKGSKEVTVKTDASTTYTKDGRPADKNIVIIGAILRVKGVFNKANYGINATSVRVIDKLPGTHIKGQVMTFNNTALTIRADSGTVYNVDTGKAKLFRAYRFGSTSNIIAGNTVAIWGVPAVGSTTITARWIRNISAKPL